MNDRRRTPRHSGDRRRFQRVAGTFALAGCMVVAQSLPTAAQSLPPVAQTIESAASASTTTSDARARDRSALRSAIIATVAGSVFDGVTTINGIRSGRARETNPLLGQHSARIVLMKSLLVIPQVLAEKHLVDTGHPKAARWLGYAVGGFAASVAIHNLRVGR